MFDTYANRGLRSFTAANREKSRSADHSSRAPEEPGRVASASGLRAVFLFEFRDFGIRLALAAQNVEREWDSLLSPQIIGGFEAHGGAGLRHRRKLQVVEIGGLRCRRRRTRRWQSSSVADGQVASVRSHLRPLR